MTPPAFGAAGKRSPDPETRPEAALNETDQRPPMRWLRWHLRALVLAALLGCLGVFALMRLLAAAPQVPANWRLGDSGQWELVSSPQASLQPLVGRGLLAIEGTDGRRLALESFSFEQSPRWMVDDAARSRFEASQQELAALMRQPQLTLVFDNGQRVAVTPRPRGFGGLGTLFWVLAPLALMLYLMGAVVMLVRPGLRHLTYLLMTLCQAGNLLLIGIELAPGIAMPLAITQHGLLLRAAFDLVTVTAMAHGSTLPPMRQPGGAWQALAAWALTAAVIAYTAWPQSTQQWWWLQGAVLVLGLWVIQLLTRSYRIEANPVTVMMRRFTAVGVGTQGLLAFAVVLASRSEAMPQGVAAVGSVIWYIFIASLLLLLPFLSRTQPLMREFALLAGISTVATSLDLLFVAIFSLGQFASLSLAVFLSLGIYAAARQWLLSQMMGGTVLTTERMFEHLYRMVREVESHPQRGAELLTGLLRDLFEPLEVRRVAQRTQRSRVIDDGSALLVPLPRIGADDDSPPETAIALRFAGRGRRMFTRDDARLTDRVLEQLRRAVAYEKAVERGRAEERLRIAQDLHDDIGARLLTLMYKAQSPEMEDYVRHTLKDLKTLTRGLAAPDHPLSHAAAEWKADIAQRLTAAHIELSWSFQHDQELMLSVVQWSALTRILRELVSNSIYHAGATRVVVVGTVERGRLSLSLADDGSGSAPEKWSHGLGLGGVRKRVKLLGGVVSWRENQPQGIVCEVLVPELVREAAA